MYKMRAARDYSSAKCDLTVNYAAQGSAHCILRSVNFNIVISSYEVDLQCLLHHIIFKEHLNTDYLQIPLAEQLKRKVGYHYFSPHITIPVTEVSIFKYTNKGDR